MLQSMRFATIPSPDVALPTYVDWAREAEALGFDAFGVPDTPLLMREAYVSLTAIALATRRIDLMLTVTNAQTRDPSVTAGAILAIDDLAPGRLAVGFGSGDSSTYGTGLGGSRLTATADYVRTVRELVRGEEVEFNGRRMRAAWSSFAPLGTRFLWAAHGERSLYLAGTVADGVISGFGLLPETIARAEELVRNGAADAGRDPDDVEIWYRTHVSPGTTLEEGFLRSNMASAYLLGRNGFAGKLVPPEFEGPLRAIGETFSLQTHSRANPEALEIARSTGLLEYLTERAGGFIGPVDYASQVEKHAANGVRNLVFVLLGDDKPQVMRDLAATVLHRRRLLPR